MNFSASADYRGEGRIVQHSIIMHHIRKLEFRPEDVVLDVGCGSGEETRSIATKVRSITGIDSSEDMLDVARKHNSASNLTYSAGDAQTCGDNPLWQGKFDKVMCFFILHWVPDEIRALTSICACLKSGGEALFIIAGEDDDFLLSEAGLFLRSHSKWGDYLQTYRPASVRLWSRSVTETEKVFRACCWAHIQCEIERHEHRMSEQEVKLCFKTCLDETQRIPKAELEEYLDDLWKWSLSRYGQNSPVGYADMHLTVIVIHAFK